MLAHYALDKTHQILLALRVERIKIIGTQSCCRDSMALEKDIHSNSVKLHLPMCLKGDKIAGWCGAADHAIRFV